jgi:hypothetical protein
MSEPADGASIERKEILFDGFTSEEILNLPSEQIEDLILNGRPQVFRIGSATVLGEFRLAQDKLIIELAQIDSGGEGILAALGSLVHRYARLHQIHSVEWFVHAVNCAKPNLKLRRVLDRRGFEVREVPGIGEAYHLVDNLPGGLKHAAS